MKGLEGNKSFRNMLTREQRELAEYLAQIEDEDADRCAHCGGEDCICCEYYHDRQKWVEPDELFSDYDQDYYYRRDEDDEEEEE